MYFYETFNWLISLATEKIEKPGDENLSASMHNHQSRN